MKKRNSVKRQIPSIDDKELYEIYMRNHDECKKKIHKQIDYMENAHFMRAELQKLGLRVYGGENAPYLWVKTPNNTPSWKFFEEMLYGASVVCTPGVGFGPSGEGYIRLTAFGEHEDCKEAMERIAKWLGK